MGNRAVITQSTSPNAPCIYIHWNGGRASVEGFLEAARRRGICGEGVATMDALARLLGRSFFATAVDAQNVYRQQYRYADVDNGDNGVYVIDGSLQIVDRKHFDALEECAPEKTAAIVEHILEAESHESA